MQPIYFFNADVGHAKNKIHTPNRNASSHDYIGLPKINVVCFLSTVLEGDSKTCNSKTSCYHSNIDDHLVRARHSTYPRYTTKL